MDWLSIRVMCTFAVLAACFSTLSLCCVVHSAMMRMAGSISKSTEVMKAMQNLIRVPEIQASMMELSKEMAKVKSDVTGTEHLQYMHMEP